MTNPQFKRYFFSKVFIKPINNQKIIHHKEIFTDNIINFIYDLLININD